MHSLALNIPNRKGQLKGGTLVYTLMIGLLVSMIMGAYILLNFLQQKQLDRLYHEQLARNNAYSGLELLLSQPVNWGSKQEISLFDNEVDSVLIQTEKWGLLGLVHATGIHGKAQVEQTALIGGNLQGPHRFSLLLSDSREPLTLVGKTRLEGPLYLPAAGLRRGFIGRKGFEGKNLFTGQRLNSRGKTLRLHSSWLDSLSYEAEVWPAQFPAARFELADMVHQQAWDTVAHRIDVPGSVTLREGLVLRGKVKIVASGRITVEAGVILQDVILIAPEIDIQSGFGGRLQALATRRLLVGEGVKLAYPSFLCVAKTEGDGAVLKVGQASQIEGAVLYLGQLLGGQKHRDDRCQLGPEALVAGVVHASHNLDLQGTAVGRVSTGNFLLQTPGATYRNHLLDTKISVQGLSHTFAGPLIFPQEAHRVIQWLAPSPSITEPSL